MDYHKYTWVHNLLCPELEARENLKMNFRVLKITMAIVISQFTLCFMAPNSRFNLVVEYLVVEYLVVEY